MAKQTNPIKLPSSKTERGSNQHIKIIKTGDHTPIKVNTYKGSGKYFVKTGSKNI